MFPSIPPRCTTLFRQAGGVVGGFWKFRLSFLTSGKLQSPRKTVDFSEINTYLAEPRSGMVNKSLQQLGLKLCSVSDQG